jgi:hypothetical protein
MSDLFVPDELVEKLQHIAEHEQRPVEEVLRAMIEEYTPKSENTSEALPENDPLAGLIGLLDDEIQATDLSSTIRETLKQHTHPEYGWTKRDRTD